MTEPLPKTHLIDRKSSVVWLITRLSYRKIPWRPCFAVKRHGWFLAWPPCQDTGLMLKTGASRIKKLTLFNSKQVRGFCVQNPYQWLVTASSLDCDCYKSGSPPVWKLKSHQKPGFAHTHTHTHTVGLRQTCYPWELQANWQFFVLNHTSSTAQGGHTMTMKVTKLPSRMSLSTSLIPES